MNTILQKRIEEEAKNYADSLALPEWDKRSIHAIDFKRGAVAALHNQWISVDEALPELLEERRCSAVSEIVLIRCNNGAITRARYIKIIGEFTTCGWKCVDAGFGLGGDKVTHWMPMPAFRN